MSAGLHALVLTVVVVVVVAATGAQAQGLITMQTLSAPLAHELVGEAVADRLSKKPPTTVPQTPLPNVTYAVGGVTIMASGVAIGALSVSGTPSGQFDEEWARKALAKI
jgi:uncharacterized protein GlcG (DUF336 family)